MGFVISLPWLLTYHLLCSIASDCTLVFNKLLFNMLPFLNDICKPRHSLFQGKYLFEAYEAKNLFYSLLGYIQLIQTFLIGDLIGSPGVPMRCE